MKSIRCGTCRRDYNFPHDMDTTNWVEQHILNHQRNLSSIEENYECMRSQSTKYSKELIFKKIEQLFKEKK